MKRITSIILAALLLAGCGSIEEEVTRKAPAAPVTEQTDDVAGETVTHIMTTINGTTPAVSDTTEKPKETTAATETHINLNGETAVMFTTSQQREKPDVDMSDAVSIFHEGFLDTVTSAEFREFDERRYMLEGEKLTEIKVLLSTFAGKKCEDPVIDGGYLFVLNDSAGTEHYLVFALNYVCFDGQYFQRDIYDAGESMAMYFRAEGRCVESEHTNEFELVMLRPGGKSGYVVHDTYGLTSFSLKDGSLEQMPAGTMLKITWSGRIAELYPSILEDVTSVTLANNLANPDRPDFVTENLPALVEACRGKDDYSDEIEKLTGLKKCEKDALMWLVGNELFSETQ